MAFGKIRDFLRRLEAPTVMTAKVKTTIFLKYYFFKVNFFYPIFNLADTLGPVGAGFFQIF